MFAMLINISNSLETMISYTHETNEFSVEGVVSRQINARMKPEQMYGATPTVLQKNILRTLMAATPLKSMRPNENRSKIR